MARPRIDRALVAELLDGTMSRREIAEAAGCSESGVRLVEQEVGRRARVEPVRPGVRATVIADWTVSHDSTRALAARHGVSQQRVSQILASHRRKQTSSVKATTRR